MCKSVKITPADYQAITGNTIAIKLNCHYDGIQDDFAGGPGWMQFTCNVTGGTVLGNTFEEVREKLEKMRRAFNG